MKNFTKTTLSIIAVLLISLTFVQCDSAVTKFMKVQADATNKQCPLNMGGGMTMDKCTVEENRTFKFTFTVADELISQINIDDSMKPIVVQALKGTPDFKQIEQFEISCIYAYYDKQGKLLGEIKITPEDYK